MITDYITVQEIRTTAKVGAPLQRCLIEATNLAFSSQQDATVQHDGKVYRVNLLDVLDLVTKTAVPAPIVKLP